MTVTPEASILVADGFLHTADADGSVYPHGSILIEDGVITAVGDAAEVATAIDPARRDALDVIDARGMLVLPGFVNSHWHEGAGLRFEQVNRGWRDIDDGPSSFARGGDIRYLSQRFDQAYDLHELMEPDEALAVARYSLWTQLRCGTTTLGDVGSVNHPDQLVRAALSLGIRGVFSVWASDAMCVEGDASFTRTRDAGEVLARIDELLARADSDPSGRIRAMPSIIYAPNMTDELGAGVRDLAERYDTPVATHLSALSNEAEVVTHHFGSSPIERFADLGLLTDRLIAVHCAYADSKEQQMLVDAGVHLSHAPAKYGTSGESVISSRSMIELARRGLRLSVSTDGEGLPLGGMTEAMSMAWLAHNEVWSDASTVRPSDALAMGTRVAAEGLRWAEEIGSLAVGKQADVVLVGIDDWRYDLCARPLEMYLRLGSSNDVDTVLVGGRVLVRGGRCVVADEGQLREEYVEAQCSVAARAGVDPDRVRALDHRFQEEFDA